MRDQDGRMVIRPLNDQEKHFLNSFYEEAIGANFMHDRELKKLHDDMKSLKKAKKLTNDESERLTYLQMSYFARADEVLLYTNDADQKKIYGENNARNRCLFNRSKSIGMLDELNDEIYDEIHNNLYSDPNRAEDYLINKITKKK